MATNYMYIDLSTTLPASGLIRVQDSDSSDWMAHGQTVAVGLSAPTGSYTHYKLWGYSPYLTEGSVSWTTIVSGTVDVNLDVGEEGIQHLYAKFAESVGGANPSSTITASGISYSWTEPTKQVNLSWVSLADNHDLSNTLRSSTDSCDMTFTDANFKHLQLHSRDFSGVQMQNDKVTVTSGSQIWKLVEYDSGAYVELEKTFPTDARPIITMEVDGEHTALTTYSGTSKAGLSSGDAARLNTYSWNSGNKKLNFNITKFSTYGFTTLDDISYTLDSTNAGYNGNSISLKVRVTDTNGEGVESAPVTFSGIAGDTIGNLSVNTIYTNATGYATATLNLTAEGTATYRATVDALTADQITTCYAVPTSLQRSLLTQYEQIRRSETYSATISGVNTLAVAEPSGSTDDAGSDDVLEHDMNVFRTLIDQMKGTTNWYDTMPTYSDPTDTDNDLTANLATIAGETLDAHTIINAVEATASGVGFTVSGTMTGWLYSTNVGYANATGNILGLCVFASTTNSGSWYDEGGTDDVCVVDLIDTSTGAEFTQSGNDYIIYAKLHDGEDFAGSGNNYDVYVRFYSNDAPYTWTASDPTNITMIFPRRKRLTDMEEHEWMRTDFVSRFEGDDAMVDDMVNLWSYTGGGDDVVGPSWTNTTDYYVLDAADNLTEATDGLNTQFGDRDYSATGYLTDGETITASLNALDAQIEINADDIGAATGLKLVEALAGNVSAGVEHAIPDSNIYTPLSTAGEEGKNMDVYFNGQLLAASTGSAGVNEDRDYAETSVSGITFHEDVYQDDNITYVIRV